MTAGKTIGAVIVLLLIVGAAVYSLKANNGGSQQVLHVLNYSEYIDPEVIQQFEKETGIKVVYDEYEAAEEAWPILMAGGKGYDVIITAHTYVGLAAEMGLLTPLNKSLIPNLANLDPRIASHPADPEQRYAVPYMWGTTGIAYVSSCVDNPPRTWSAFLDPDYLSTYTGRVSLLSEFSETIMAAMIALGYDPSVRDNWNDDVMAQVESLLKSLKPYLAGFYGASEYMPGLQTGRLCLAQAWNGDVLVVREENPEVHYVNPDDGAIFWVDYMVIPKDADNVEAAHMFINYLLRPDVMAKNVEYVLYAASIKKDILYDWARQNNDTQLLEILDDPLVYPPPSVHLIPSPVLDEEMSTYVETVRLHVMGQG